MSDDQKSKLIYNDIVGWMEIEDKGEVNLLPSFNWFSAAKFTTIFGVFGILIASTAAEAKTTAKRRIKRSLIEVPSELNQAGIRVFRPFPDPFQRPIPGLQWSKEAFNNVLIQNAFLASQYDKLQASQLAYLKNFAYFFQTPAANEGLGRLTQASQLEAEKRMIQRAYANSYVPNLNLNEIDLMVLSAKSGVVGAVSGYLAYSLLNFLFSSEKRKNFAMQFRGGFLDPASMITSAVFSKAKELAGNFLKGKKDEIKDKLDLGNLLNNLGGEKKKEKRFPIEISNPLLIAITGFIALIAFFARGGKMEDLPVAGSVVGILKPKPSFLEKVTTNIKWLYNPTEMQGIISWTLSGVTIYLLIKHYPNLTFTKRPIDAINSAMNSILELTKVQFDKLTNMVQQNYVESKADMVNTRTEAAKNAKEVQKSQAEEIKILKSTIQNGQSENSALQQIYGQAQLTSASIQNSLEQCRNDVKEELVFRAKADIYKNAVANTQAKLGHEIATQEHFVAAVESELRNSPINVEAINEQLDAKYPNPSPIPPLSDAIRDHKLKAIEDKKALEIATGGKPSKKW